MITSRIQTFHRIFCREMTTVASDLYIPAGVRGMTSLDRDKFLRTIKVPVLKVHEENLSGIFKSCKKYLLKLENFKPVQNFQDNCDEVEKKMRYVYLHPEKLKQWCDIVENDRQTFEKNGVTISNFDIKELNITYENWRIEQVFKSVLPEGEEIVSGFSQIGHIIHLNLRDHLLDYKLLIGQVLLDKIKTCRTVVNKCNIIHNTFRNFSMEVIAGEHDFEVTVKENRCTYQFDFSKVYWNPRLGKEHERIIALLKPDDILFDVFCGVGPFSIPAAKRKCKVFANDLNPECFKWLNHNAKINKVNMKLFNSYNDDGINFIENVFKDYLKKCCDGKEKIPDGSRIHVTMNLPAMAVEFLKYFNRLLADEEEKNFNCDILVHVYCFVMGDKLENVAKEMVVSNLQCNITGDIVEIVNVRNVAPNKEMMRISFKLTKEVLFNGGSAISDVRSEPPPKRLCVNDSA